MIVGKCEKCGGDTEMYYKPWCPICDKPKIKTVQSLNLLQALRHVECLTKDEDYKNRMWKNYFCGLIPGNDSSFRWSCDHPLDMYQAYHEYEYNRDTGSGKYVSVGYNSWQPVKDIILLLRAFPEIRDGILWEVSW